jgi:hypothetical protein
MSEEPVTEDSAELSLEDASAKRIAQLIPAFKHLVNKRMTKSDLVRIIYFMADFPFRNTPTVTDKKMATINEMIKMIQQDKTFLTISAMGGKFVDEKEKSNE